MSHTGSMLLLQAVCFCSLLKVYEAALLVSGEPVQIHVRRSGIILVDENGTLSSGSRRNVAHTCFRKLQTNELSVFQFQMLTVPEMFLQVTQDGEVFVGAISEGSANYDTTYDEFVIDSLHVWTTIYTNSDRVCSLAFDRETGDALNACERSHAHSSTMLFYIRRSPVCANFL